ncbi:MAG: aspartate aminotransferase family protein [Vicinamibacterales bacterium]
MLPGTEVLSRARTKALFSEEQGRIAPGLQTIALLSELAVDHGRGCTLVDLDGNQYLDLNAGVSVASIGHAHPRYVEALTRQLQAVTVGSFTTRARASLTELIARLAPGNLTRTQYFSGGAEAVEAAIKLARSHTKKTDIVGFTGGFHGKTAGVLPISDVGWKHAVGPLPPGYHIAPYPDPTMFDGTPEECLEFSINALRALIEDKAADRLAAILVEPVQGTAGNIVPPAGFLARVQAVAHEFGALLIADEMITGFGRTGLLFGSNHDGVVPDIMTTGKGMAGGFPMSAVISTDEIVKAEPFSLPSASSSSYGGNPLASAAGLVTISTIVDENLTEAARVRGAQFVDGLRRLAAKHGTIANVRGRGLLVGFDFVRPGTTRSFLPKDPCIAFFKECVENGVIAMSYTPRVRIHPPLIISEAEVNQALEVFDAALGRMQA